MTITVQYVLNLFPQTLFKPPPNVLIRRENRRTDLCRRPIPRESYIFLLLTRTGSPDAVMCPLGATGLTTALILLLTGIFLFLEEAVRLTIRFCMSRPSSVDEHY